GSERRLTLQPADRVDADRAGALRVRLGWRRRDQAEIGMHAGGGEPAALAPPAGESAGLASPWRDGASGAGPGRACVRPPTDCTGLAAPGTKQGLGERERR